MDPMSELQPSGMEAGPKQPRRYPRLMGAIVILAAVGLVAAMAKEHYRLKGLPPSAPAPAASGPGAVLLPSTAPLGSARSGAAAGGEVWRKLDDGLEFGDLPAPRKAEAGDSRILVLRIDPRRYEFRLMCASAAADKKPLTARQWCQQHGLAAAINASMYAKDELTSVSLLKGPRHQNNSHVSADKMMLVFEPTDPAEPPARLVDLDRQTAADVLRKYSGAAQNIRMISQAGKNVWRQQPRKPSVAAIGMDRQGMILFIHSRSAYTVHDLIDMLMEMPLGLTMCMYVEGGSPAQMYVRSGGFELEAVGNYEALPDGENKVVRAVPNVIGIVNRPQ